ncbi:MAG: DNA repair protein RecN [Parvularculaceae bacterium]
MLVALSIRDLVTIDALDIELSGGLIALTGETGAGKSALLEGLSLALGARARRQLLRAGATQGGASASFDLAADHPARAALRYAGILIENGELVTFRRVLTGQGGARGFINDQPASAALMQEIGGLLVEIHGQRDDLAFLRAAGHLALLDAFAGHERLLSTVADRFAGLREARQAYEAARSAAEDAAARAEELRAICDEMERLAPSAGEAAALAAERAELAAAETVRGELAEAGRAIADGGPTEDQLGRALRALERSLERMRSGPDAEDGPMTRAIAAAVEAIDRALIEMAEARQAVEAAAEAAAGDPERLERVEERLFALRGAARKHRVEPDELPDILARARDGLDALEDGGRRFDALEKAVAAAQAAYDAAAAELSASRREAAKRLDAAVMRELKPLKLDRAKFRTRIDATPARRQADGVDQAAFEVSTNPGAPFGPMEKIASGGEFSRFVLALKTALAASGGGKTIVFDEIDRGVGGAAADAIGERLARLAAGGQAVVVTHSPQVAARADHHWLLSKKGAKSARTSARPLDAAGRREEIARMLAGADITDEARAAASRLLAPGAGGAGKSAASKRAAPKKRRAAAG